MDLERLDPVALGAALSQLPPDHALVAAARAAVDVADGRAEQARAMAETSIDVAAAARATNAARADVRQMYAARATVDGPDSRSAAKAAELAAPAVPDPRPPAGAELPADTAAAVAMARQWVADRAADDADMQRRAEEARWVEADHAEEVAALDAAHTVSR